MIYSLAFWLLISAPLWAQTLWAQTSEGQAEEETQPETRLSAKALVIKPPYQPITVRQRAHWALRSTIGPEGLIAGVLSSGISTATNEPREYGATWGGFGHRYGTRLTGISISNAMEAGLGAIWGEDPRYERAPDAPFGGRVWNAIELTFAARYTDGHVAPAYARLIAIPGNNLLSDAWRASSETHPGDVAVRSLLGVLGRMGANAFVEFWPDVRRRITRHKEER